MKIIKNDSLNKEDMTNKPLFYGGQVSREEIVGNETSSYFNFSLVHFAAGAKNKFHTHTSDQILFVTEGTGIVANESKEVNISKGDTAFIPAGEKHWHGAVDTSDFTHISLLHPTSRTGTFE